MSFFCSSLRFLFVAWRFLLHCVRELPSWRFSWLSWWFVVCFRGASLLPVNCLPFLYPSFSCQSFKPDLFSLWFILSRVSADSLRYRESPWLSSWCFVVLCVFHCILLRYYLFRLLLFLALWIHGFFWVLYDCSNQYLLFLIFTFTILCAGVASIPSMTPALMDRKFLHQSSISSFMLYLYYTIYLESDNILWHCSFKSRRCGETGWKLDHVLLLMSILWTNCLKLENIMWNC